MDQISWRPDSAGLVPHVNGRDLRQLVGDLTLTGIASQLVRPPSGHLLGGSTPGDSAEGAVNLSRRVPVLVCSCGEIGCGSVTVSIRLDRGVVVWEDFRGLDGGRLHLGPFTFARKPYELARGDQEPTDTSG